jgi:hypothetical protein
VGIVYGGFSSKLHLSSPEVVVEGINQLAGFSKYPGYDVAREGALCMYCTVCTHK